MAILGLILLMVLGAWLGDFFDAPFLGLLLGGLLGWMLARGRRSWFGPDQAMQEITRLQTLQENQRQHFENEISQLRERITALESGVPYQAAQAEPAETEVQSAAAPVIAAHTLAPESDFEPAFDIEAPAVEPAAARAQQSVQSDAIANESEAPALASQSQPAAEPGIMARMFAAARNWLLGGNTLVRVGVVLVFLGLAFLLRYASDRVVLPVELRYLGVATTALLALGLGWRLRESRRAYGLLMQGAAIAVMYLTIFAAMRLHPLLPMQGGFMLLVAVAILAGFLAVMQDALALAVAGSLGGFAAPILASTGGGSHVALFSYFALLNAGILGIAWFKAWRPLNLVGFFGTFLIGLMWGLRSYLPEHYASTQAFLILFFLMFVAIGLLFARRVLLDDPAVPQGVAAGAWWGWVKNRGASLRHYVDGTLLFGTPLVGFGLQYALVKDTEYAAAFSALALGVFYMLLARLVYSRTQTALRLLVEVLLALGVVFASLAIPLGLDATWTTAAWAAEAAGIYWVGQRQQRSMWRAFALLLQTGAILAWLSQLDLGVESLLSGSVLGALLLGVALLCNAWSLSVALRDEKNAGCWDSRLLPVFNTLGLWFLYLLAPLLLQAQGTAVAWALAGVLTVFIGLRLQARAWLANALLLQLLAGCVFLFDMQPGQGADALGVLSMHGSGWRGLIVSSLVGAAALCSVFLAVRMARDKGDAGLENKMGWLMLFGLSFMALAALFVLPWAQVTGVWAGSGFLLMCLALWLALLPAFWFALLLQLVAGVAYLLANFSSRLFGMDFAAVQAPAFMHSGFWTPAIIALAAFGVAWRLVVYARRAAQATSWTLKTEQLTLPALIWSALWWALAWWGELARLLPDVQASHAFLALIALTVILWGRVARRESWGAPLSLGSTILLLTVAVALQDYAGQWQPFGEWGWLAYALVLAAHLGALRQDSLLPPKLAQFIHLAGVWAGLLVLSLESRHLLLMLSEPGSAWRWLGWVIPLVLCLFWSARHAVPRLWPASEQPALYRFRALLPVVLVLFGWVGISALKSAGVAAPLPYIPLLNPLEIAQLLVLFASWQWLRRLSEAHDDVPVLAHWGGLLKPVLLALAFVVYTMAVLRANHHIGEMAWQADIMARSMLVQASLSIAWSTLALALMVIGHRHALRRVWISGAILVAIVVAKMFFIELSNQGGLERIVSFIGVGILLLLVGYFAPLPPASVREKEV